MTDREIVKGLECCRYEYDTKCELCCYNFYSKTGCRGELRRNALELINRLQAENERLNVHYNIALETVGEFKEENDRLRDINEKLAMDIDAKQIVAEAEIVRNAKAEAYKEFAERLKEQAEVYTDSAEDVFMLAVGTSKIDNLLKELVGE